MNMELENTSSSEENLMKDGKENPEYIFIAKPMLLVSVPEQNSVPDVEDNLSNSSNNLFTLLPIPGQEQSGVVYVPKKEGNVISFNAADALKPLSSTTPESTPGTSKHHSRARSDSTIDRKLKNMCCICGKEFSAHSRVLRHQKAVHPIFYHSQEQQRVRETAQKISSYKKTHACELCDKLFCRMDHVLRHMKQIHNLDVSENHTTVSFSLYDCPFCNKYFSSLFFLNVHKRNSHGLNPRYAKSLKCSKCLLSFPSVTSFHKHLDSHEDITLKTVYAAFSSPEDFEKWKTNVEKENNSFYVHRDQYSSSKGIVDEYSCHQNGESSKNKKEKLCKTEFFCPSRIIAETDGFQIDVTYHMTHVGHECEVNHIKTTKVL